MITVIEFDFAARKDRPIPIGDAETVRQAGRFCWVDVAAPTEAETE